MCKQTVGISMAAFSRSASVDAYCNQIVCIAAMKILNSDARREGCLALECLVEALPKIRLRTQSLQDEYTHSDKALLSRIVPVVDSIEEDEHNEIVGSAGVYNERTEPLVALQCLPKKHYHLRSPCQ